MKMKLSFIAIMLSFHGMSCDVCGVASGIGSQGILPGNQFHFIGIHTNYRQFKSFQDVLFTDEDRISYEHFMRTNISGRWQFSKRWAFGGAIPYAYNWQHQIDTTVTKKGLGDFSVHLSYLIINRSDSTSTHQLRCDIGIKLPTGNYSRSAFETSNLFPGTGSVDALFRLNYQFRRKKWGVLGESAYGLQGTNPVDYRFGNSLVASISLFGIKQTQKSNQLLPFIGANYQWFGTDEIDKIPVGPKFNAGHLFSGEFGLQYIRPNWMLHVRFSHPVYQRLSEGNVQAIIGNTELGIRYLIQKK